MEWRRDYLGGEAVETVYLGGGTPSLLTGDDLRSIMDRLRSQYDILPDAEITLEANPDDITTNSELAGNWVDAGINRLSIGIQSFREADLRWMNRAHTARQAEDAIKIVQDKGLDNISIDLIYGTPGLTDAYWEENIRRAVGLGIPHLSCYALTVEPKTALDKMIHLHKKEDVNPDDQARQFLLLMDRLEMAGYEHYEISNFARPGHRSRHNSSYWRGKAYLGLGPSAHSYNGRAERQWNVANNARYISALGDSKMGDSGIGDLAMTGLFEKEVLTGTQQLNETIMIALRTMEGIDLRVVASRFGEEAALVLERNVASYLAGGMMVREDMQLRLTHEGRLLADGIAADLFFD